MRFKLFAVVLFLTFVSSPVFAQGARNQRGVDQDRPAPSLLLESADDEGDAEDEEEDKGAKEVRETSGKKEKRTKELKSKTANEHRSAVADFVSTLLDVADRQALGGIGEQVREIAKQQNASEDKVTAHLEEIKNQNRIRTFLFGTDFGKTREIKKEMQEAQLRLRKLEQTKDDIDRTADKVALETEIQDLQENINSVLSEVEAEEKKFSLFGWVKKLLNR